MVIRDNKAYIPQQELLQLVPEDFRERLNNTVKVGTRRNREGIVSTWQHLSSGGETLICYESIPEVTRTNYDLPELGALTQRSLEKLIKVPGEAITFFKDDPNTFKYAGELAAISGWMIFLAGVTRKAAASIGFPTKDALYDTALQVMNSKKYHCWRCASVQALKSRKLKPFQRLFKAPLNGNYSGQDLRTALKSLISKKYGNSNSSKLTEEQEALLIQIYAEPNKPNFEQTWMMYLRRASEKVSTGEWSEKCLISARTVKRFLTRPDIEQLWFPSRHGLQAYRKDFEMITKRTAASFANAMWVGDGTPVHRYYFDPKTKQNYARLNVFPVLDAHSWCVLGFFLSWKETAAAVKGAFRAACNLSGYVPHQIQYDNSSALKSFDAQQCLSALSPNLTPAAVGNSRSKIIEPFFKHFNEQVLRFRTGFTGSPVMGSNINSKPNPEYLAHLVKTNQIKPIEQAIQEIHEDFSIWNHRIMKKYGKSPLDRYKESIRATMDKQRPYTPQIEIDAFYTMPGNMRQVKVIEEGKARQRQSFFPKAFPYTNRGIELEINKQEYTFLIDDPEFNSRYIGSKFQIKYDPEDLSKGVYLYQDDEPFLLNGKRVAAPLFEGYHMALADHVDGEAKSLYEHRQNKKAQLKITTSRFEEAIHRTKLNGTYTRAITENAFDKEVLTAANADRMEQLVNGDEYRLEKAGDSSTEASEKAENKSKSKSFNRWE
jgi:transposase InsO family protein